MGLQQSRQAPPKPLEQQRPQAEPEPTFDGLIPRSLTARQACNARRVRRLIRAGRLGPCWRELDAEGEECPVCMEVYERLNSTACCHQDICTECFICVVAPGGVSTRCPYCQAHALQVYLRPLPCGPADAEPAAEAAAAAEGGSVEASAAASDTPLGEHVQPSRPPSGMAGTSSSAGGSSGTTRAVSTASSGLSMDSLDLEGHASVPFTAFLAPAPAAAARAAVRQHQEAMRLGCCPGAAGSGCGSVMPVSISLGCDLRLLAEAAANASRAEGPAIVAMVRRASEPGNSGSGPSSSSAPGSSGGSGGAAEGEPSSAGGLAASSSEQPAAPAAELGAPPEEPRLPAEGGPAVLQLPDGSEQLVLLRSAQQEAAEEAAARAAALRRQQEQQAADAAALPTYQPPATQEDQRVRQAIAQADTALLQHQPASTSRAPGGDWLERMRQADAALQAAVARNDAQRFDASSPAGADQGTSSSD